MALKNAFENIATEPKQDDIITAIENLSSLVDVYLAVSPPYTQEINEHLTTISSLLESFVGSDSPVVTVGDLKDCLDSIYSAVDGLELSVDNIDINTDEVEEKLDNIAYILSSMSGGSPSITNQDVIDAIESFNTSFNNRDLATETTQTNVLAGITETNIRIGDNLATPVVNTLQWRLDQIKDAIETLEGSIDDSDAITVAKLEEIRLELEGFHTDFSNEDFSSETTLSAAKVVLDNILISIDAFKAAFDARDLATETTLGDVKTAIGDEGTSAPTPNDGSGQLKYLRGIFEQLLATLETNINVGSSPVSGANPVPITGNVVSSGAELTVDKVIDVSNYDLQSSAFTITTAIGGDFKLSGFELNFTTNESKTIILKTQSGAVLFSAHSTELQTALDISLAGDDRAFEDGDQLTLEVSQTSGPCFMEAELKIVRGALPLSGNPALQASDDIFDTYRDTDNSGAGDALAADEQIYTPWVDTLGYATLIASAFSDVDSASDSYAIQFSADQSNVRASTPPISLIGGFEKTIPTSSTLRYARLAYKNGSVAQTDFLLSLKRTVLPHNARLLSDTIDSLGNHKFDHLNDQPAPLTNGAVTALVVDDTTDEVLSVAHGLEDGQRVVLTLADPVVPPVTNELPAGLEEDVAYFVINKTDDTFQLAIEEGSGATPVDITDTGTGTFFYQQRGWFRGEWVDASDFGHFLTFIISTSEPQTARIEWSANGVDPIGGIVSTTTIPVEEFLDIPNIGTLYAGVYPATTMIRPYYRLEHVNGPTNEIPTLSAMSAFVGKHAYQGSFAGLTAALSPLSTALLVRSVEAGTTFAGDFKNKQLEAHDIDFDNTFETTPLTNEAPVALVVDDTTDRILSVAHGLIEGDPIVFTVDDSDFDVLPDPLKLETPYYVVNATDDDFQISENPNVLTPVDITDTGTGTFEYMKRGMFLGEWVDVSQIGHLLTLVFDIQEPAWAGFEWSDDGETVNSTLVRGTSEFTYKVTSGGEALPFDFYVAIRPTTTFVGQYVRIRQVNGINDQIPQTFGTINFIGKGVYPGTFLGLEDNLTSLSTAQLVRSVEAGTTIRGEFKNKLLEEHDIDVNNIIETTGLTNGSVTPFTVDVGQNRIDSIAHGLTLGDAIVFTTDLDLPEPFTEEDVYYVAIMDDDWFQVSTTPYTDPVDVPTPVTITNEGTGTHNYQQRGMYLGDWVDASQFGHLLFFVFDSQEPALSRLEWSDDKETPNTSIVRSNTVASYREIESDPISFHVALAPVTTFVAKYYRLRQVNGPSNQIPGLFSTIPFIGKGQYSGTYVGIEDDLSILSTGLVTKSLGVGVEPSGRLGNLAKQGQDVNNSANGRIVADGEIESGTKILYSTEADFREGEEGLTISGTGIPASTTVAKVLSSNAVRMSAEATATATGVSITFGVVLPADTGGSDHIFVGKWIRWQNDFINLAFDSVTDVAGTVIFEFSEKEVPKEDVDDDVQGEIIVPYTTQAVNSLLRRHSPIQSKWVRVKWVNGILPQTFFNLDTAFTVTAVNPPLSPISVLPNGDNLAESNNSTVMLKDPESFTLIHQEYTEGNTGKNGGNVHITGQEEPFSVNISTNSNAIANQRQVGSTNPVRLDVSPLVGRKKVRVVARGITEDDMWLAIGFDNTITFETASELIKTDGIGREYHVDDGVELYGIVETGLAGSSTDSTVVANAAPTGTATLPENAQTSNDVRSTIDANGETIVFSEGVFDDPLTGEESLESMDFIVEGKKDDSSLPAVAIDSLTKHEAGNVNQITSTTQTLDATNLYVVTVSWRDENQSISDVTSTMGFSGFTIINQSVPADSNQSRTAVIYMTGTPTSTGVISVQFGAAVDHCTLGIMQLSNVNLANPIQESTKGGQNTLPDSYSLDIDGDARGRVFVVAGYEESTHSPTGGMSSNGVWGSNSNNDNEQDIASKAIVATGNQNITGDFTGQANFTLVAFSVNPDTPDDPILSLDFTKNGLPMGATQFITLTTSNDTDFPIDLLTLDPTLLATDIPDIGCTITGLTIDASLPALIDVGEINMTEISGATARISIYQEG